MMSLIRFVLAAALFLQLSYSGMTEAFMVNPHSVAPTLTKSTHVFVPYMAADEEGVVELVDEDETTTTVENTENKQVAPFLSQGEIADDVLNPDLSDPKQTRVIIYTILSLLPVLFLIPLMLASRDLIPLDDVPPVPM